MKENNNEENFKPGRQSDPDEVETHIQPRDISRSVEAPSGVFVDVPKGMVAVPGAEVDGKGILRKSETGELAIWHHRCPQHGPCDRYTSGPDNFVAEDEVVYRDGAPWCPDCLAKEAEDENRKKLQEMFRGNAQSN